MLQPRQPVLSVQDAQLALAGVSVLNGLSLELHSGELLGLLGPNGAGKTTLIQCLANRRQLDSGRIRIAYAGNVADVLGIVPQEIAVYPELTVVQNLTCFGRLHGLSGRLLRTRVADALAWANLADRRRSPAKVLSGGMQRRLNIACSVLHQPSILLLDEPTVGVDPQSRERIYAMLDTLLDQGTAILLTTHQLDEAETRCDRLAIVDAGRLIASGTIDELLQRTIGNSQRINIRFATPQVGVPAPLALHADGTEASGWLSNTSDALPDLLVALRQADARIEHLTVREPSLQNMFLHLTGKELRE